MGDDAEHLLRETIKCLVGTSQALRFHYELLHHHKHIVCNPPRLHLHGEEESVSHKEQRFLVRVARALLQATLSHLH